MEGFECNSNMLCLSFKVVSLAAVVEAIIENQSRNCGALN